MILGRAPEHGRPADIDLLDRLLPGDIRPRHRLNEWVEVDHDQIDGLEAMFLHGRQVGLIVPAMQDPRMHLRMQGLDPAIEHFRETGKIVDLHDLDARLSQGTSRPAGGEDLDAKLAKPPGKIDDPRFVPNTQESPPDSYVLHLDSLFSVSSPF